jgi:outer membrane assembly lipoprotein YfiO
MRPTHLTAIVIALGLVGCSTDLPPTAGSVSGSNPQASAAFQTARQSEDSGNTRRAIKQYKNVAEKYPWAEEAAEARFRQAKLLQSKGETVKAFDAYQELINRYRGSDLYTEALSTQARMAQAAADGEIKTSFLGMKSKLSAPKIVGMLNKVRENAPAAPSASRAQFAIGELYQSRGGRDDVPKAISAYRILVRDYPDSREAAEGQYRIGVILTMQAERGNQDQANIDQAREAFQDYLDRYPGHAKNADARRQLSAIGSKDVQRSFDVAEFYLKKGQTESAKFYYREVMRQSKSGDLYNRAKARLAELGE